MAISTRQESGAVLSEINITPLVDVMLVLLVAFMIAIPALNNAVHVNLPKTAPTTTPPLQKQVIVSVDVEGRVYIDKREIQPATLEAELKTLLADSPELALRLQGDEHVPYGSVARAMAAIERSGVANVSVLTAQ
ncbi:biopolymer transporter ExbD [Burkholderiaceae bacterium DAT-1]|nr:biopolymer transporter ExbD [Burkholderiaceae bacterium DAT-1]